MEEGGFELNKSTNNIGYEYTKRLHDSIDNVTTTCIIKDKYYFVYNGINHLAAYKRLMNYEMKNFGYFEEIKATYNYVTCHDNNHAMILKNMFPAIELNKNKMLSAKKKLGGQNIKSYIKKNNVINYIYNSLSLEVENICSQEGIAIIVVHLKFIKFFEEIYARLEKCLFVICGDNSRCIDYCERNNYKYIVFQRSIYNLTIGDDYEYLSKLILLYSNVVEFFSKHNFTVYLVPEGDAILYEEINLFTIETDAVCICLQHGWDSMIWPGNKDMHYRYFLTWGVFWRDILRKYNPDQQFRVIGAPAHYTYDFVDEERTSIVFLLQPVSILQSKDDLNEFLDLITEVSHHHEDVNIIVREHPSFPLNENYRQSLNSCKNVSFKNSDKYTLSEVLSNALVAVSIYSTVLAESIDFMVIPVVVNIIGMSDYVPDFNKLNIGCEVKNTIDAKIIISKIIFGGAFRDDILDNMAIHRKEYFSSNGGESVDNVVSIVNECSALSL